MYLEFEDFTRDAELLVTRKEGDMFDYVEGFAFINSDDPLTGRPSVPLDPNQRFDTTHLPQTAGSVLYCLELALYCWNYDQLSSIDTVNNTTTL